MGYRLDRAVPAALLAALLAACSPALPRPGASRGPSAVPSDAPVPVATAPVPPAPPRPAIAGGCAAVFRDDTAALEAALAAGADPNGADPQDPSGRTPLVCAVESGHLDTMSLLMRKRAHPDGLPTGAAGGRTALVAAAEEGHATAARLLLTGGATANGRDGDGWTALHWASFGRDPRKAERYVATVAALLDAGADPNAAGGNGETPLALAIGRGSTEAVRLLASRGADPNRRSPRGETPLMLAASAGNPAMVEALVAADGKVDLRDRDGKTAWVRAAERGSRPSMEILNRAGAKELFRLVDAKAAFRGALCEGDVELAKAMAGRGVKLPSGEEPGRSAVALAAKCGRAAAVRWLLEAGADPAAPDAEGKSPWVRAAERGDGEVRALLEAKGAVADHGAMSWAGDGSALGEPLEAAVTDGAAWADLWRRAFGREAPPMDFDRFFVAAVFPGGDATGGPSIAFRDAVAEGGALAVPYDLVPPAAVPGDPALKALHPGRYAMKAFAKRAGLAPAVRRVAAPAVGGKGSP